MNFAWYGCRDVFLRNMSNKLPIFSFLQSCCVNTKYIQKVFNPITNLILSTRFFYDIFSLILITDNFNFFFELIDSISLTYWNYLRRRIRFAADRGCMAGGGLAPNLRCREVYAFVFNILCSINSESKGTYHKHRCPDNWARERLVAQEKKWFCTSDRILR